VSRQVCESAPSSPIRFSATSCITTLATKSS
jgi:hypothetical protein